MAEDREERSREELTEEASPYRVEEFRRKGVVAQSKELSGLAALLAAGSMAYLMSPKMGTQISDLMVEVFRTDTVARLNFGNSDVLRTFLMKSLGLMVTLGLPICGAGFVIGVVASFAQIGSIFSTEPLMPDFGKINPIQGIRRLLSMHQLLDGLRVLFKFAVVFILSYAILKREILGSSEQIYNDPSGLASAYGYTAKVVFYSLVAALVFFAAFDFWLQRWDFSKRIRMTKQEAKQEHKEREGDPQIKARIRAIQREMARKRMLQAVKKADVVVTNPTHIAVAIVYDRKKMLAPKVIAKGADLIAQKIKQVAAEAGIPMVENVPLARTLFATVKLNHFVPRNLYQAVAEVLAYVYRLKGHKMRRE